jgi:hypothetical protein
MTRYTKDAQGQYVINGHKYGMLVGSRAQVVHGTAYKTTGGLKKVNLLQNKNGRIVSKKKHSSAKKDNRLVKAGYKTKKGHFGAIKNNSSKSKKMRGGMINTVSPFNPASLANNGASLFNPAPANTSGSSPNLFLGGKKSKTKRGGIINTQSPFNPASLTNNGASLFNPAQANTSGASANLFQGGQQQGKMRGGIINTQSPFNPASLTNNGASLFNPAQANTSGSSPNLFQGGKRRKSKRGGQSTEDINISVPSNANVDINEMPMSSLSNA